MEFTWISLILITTLGFACANALEVMLDMEKEKKKTRFFCWTIFFLVFSWVYVYRFYVLLIAVAPILYVVQKLYKNEKDAKKAISQVLLANICFILAFAISKGLFRNNTSAELMQWESVISTGIGVAINYITIYIVMNLWSKKKYNLGKTKNIWIFLLIFINEIAAVNRVIHMPNISEEAPVLMIQFLIDIGMFLVLYGLVLKEKVEKDLHQLLEYMEQERLYYQEMDREREKMAKIRHDYNNQLTSVLGLLHMGREEEAKIMLKEMRNRHHD